MSSITRFLLLGAALWLAGCSHISSQKQTEEEPEIFDITYEAWHWADSVTSAMTLRQQAAQLLMPAVYTTTDSLTIDRIRRYVEELNVGGILLLRGDALSATQIADTITSSGKKLEIYPGTIIAIDAENGLGMRLSDAPKFPWNYAVGEDVDEQTLYEYGREIGRECRGIGINMVLGPVVDINRDYSSRVMRKRSLGSDPVRVTQLSEAYAKGLESMSVLSVAKHFPGHGATATDSHVDLARLDISREELDSLDLHPFRSFARSGLSGVMVGHLWAEALDSVRRPASFSPVIINDLLREELGFRGLVLVDAVVMGGATGYSGADAISAGADIIIAPLNTDLELDNIIAAVEGEQLTADQIADRCRRILFFKYLFGIADGTEKKSAISGEDISEFLYLEADSLKNRLR